MVNDSSNYVCFIIGGSIFRHKEYVNNISPKVIMVSADWHTENQIDCLTIDKTWRTSLLDV